MKVLFEGHIYSTELDRELLPREYYDPKSKNPKPRVVGYHYSEKYNCPVIILPKVFLNENDKFFVNEIAPEIFLYDDFKSHITDPKLRNQLANFLFECSSWFYSSIKKYYYKYKDTLSLFEDRLNLIDCSHDGNFHTELDIIYSLLKFNKENQDLFIFIKKINNSQNNKIDWNKTVKKTSPIINSNNVPVYFNTLSKKKQINADEELLVLFFSLLKDIEKRYSIKVPINPYYNTLPSRELDKLKRRGTYYLRSIRCKYFDDRLLTLYRFLYKYFEKSEDSYTKDKRKEYLIIKDYNLVFQDMVDELLSDRNIPDELVKHKDGKELDHIYQSKSFFEDDDIYFIGDSKYYKRGNTIEKKSIYKQFTYAKNVIQYNIDLLNNTGNYPEKIKYRDELSEGYNITPNFFIRGIVNHLNHLHPELIVDSNHNAERQINSHFENRLFDRDTLIVQSYSINFIYVLWSYISSKSSNHNRFKNNAKKVFRESLILFIEECYNFSIVTPDSPVNDFIKQNFYNLNGKIFRPEQFLDNNSFILALVAGQSAGEYIDEFASGAYSISDYKLK